jgi:peptidoglycan/xylan/chitin deacetylase (PgdA/CDA1 family)
MRYNDMRLIMPILLLWTALTAACSGHLLREDQTPEALQTDQFILVTTSTGDTFASLAAAHLKDKDKAWQIAAFNQTETLSPGQRIVIPLIPLTRGGLQKSGYQTVPVLLYTDLAATPSTSQTVSARAFQLQLDYLSTNGYVTIHLDLFQAFLDLKDQLPPQAVVISLDTTDAWAHDIAFPAIRQRGMKAALFIEPEQVGRKGKLTWGQLAEMAGSGWDIGLYGRKIKAPAKEDLKSYLEGFESTFVEAQKAFQHYLKRPCRYFAFPQGESDDLTIAMLKKHGYEAAFTRKQGSNPFFADNYQIKRSMVSGQYDMAWFRQNLITFRSMELQ